MMRKKNGSDFTLKNFYNWCMDYWQWVGIFLFIYLTIYLTCIILPQNIILYGLLMVFPLYLLHEFEEYLIPGGFAEFFNEDVLKIKRKDVVPIDKPAIFWINMLLVWILLPVAGLLSIIDMRFGVWMPYFIIFQAISHLILGIKGKRLINPGMVSSWLIHTPFAIWLLNLLFSQGVITNQINIHLLIGILVNAILPIIGFGPFKFSLLNKYKKRINK
jgi:hypothetical protein